MFVCLFCFCPASSIESLCFLLSVQVICLNLALTNKKSRRFTRAKKRNCFGEYFLMRNLCSGVYQNVVTPNYSHTVTDQNVGPVDRVPTPGGCGWRQRTAGFPTDRCTSCPVALTVSTCTWRPLTARCVAGCRVLQLW